MSAQHTPGPWQFYADLPSADPNWHIVTNATRMCVVANVHIEPGNEMAVANARLIAAAPDHAMFGRAITSLGARWQNWNERCGEFCIGGLRYATDIDEFGVPVLNASIRAAIAKAEGAS